MSTPVLVVDDRPDNILAVEAVLEPLDVEILRANSGADALRCLLTTEVAVILLDVQMPGFDGFETAAHIKERERTRHIPIIFLTAISRELEQQLKGYGAGAVDYMAKPFEPDVLRSKVAVFAELYRSRKLIEEQNALLADRLAELEEARSTLARQAAELERSNAELERLGTLTSHELREPLFVVDGFLELLSARHGPDLDRPAASLVEQARAGARRMLDTVGGVLDYARASGAALAPSTVDLDEALRAAQRELADAIREYGLTVVSDPLPTVDGDAWQLERVFTNLLERVIRERRTSLPEVRISVTREQDAWVLSVHDNGEALSPDDLRRLFTVLPADGATQTHLGLAVCQRVVERHGGTIWAESVEGRGTTISFSLPGRPS